MYAPPMYKHAQITTLPMFMFACIYARVHICTATQFMRSMDTRCSYTSHAMRASCSVDPCCIWNCMNGMKCCSLTCMRTLSYACCRLMSGGPLSTEATRGAAETATFGAPQCGLCMLCTHMFCGLAPGGPTPPVVGDPQTATQPGTMSPSVLTGCGGSIGTLTSRDALEGLASSASMTDTSADPGSPSPET